MHFPRTPLRLGVALLLTTALSASAQDWKGRGRVNGEVDDEGGQPVVGASITLRLQSSPDQGPAPLKTDKHGKFSYLGLTGGAWTVHIEAEGFVPSEGVVSVSEFQPPPPVRITLRKPVVAEAPKPDPKYAAAQAAIDAGDAFLREKKGTEAQAEYEKALPLLEGTNRVIVLKRVATCQMIEGNDAGAVDTFKQVLAEAPQDADALRLIVDRLIVLKRDAEAQQYMAMMPQGQGVDPNTLLNMGINLYNDNKLDEAIVKFDAVIAARPEHADGYYYRGLSLLAKGKMGDAKADFNKVLELDPNGQFANDCRGFLKSL
jgi:Tfp pilus assembly protein PilF